MSCNTAHANGGVLIHAGEVILLFSDDVHLEFHGQDNQLFKGTKVGRLYLTSHRMVFTNKNTHDGMLSFSFPFVTISDVEIEQPVFGANYIKGKVRAQPNGNWVGEAKFKLMFKKGGAIEFGQAILKTATMGKSMANQYGQHQSDVPPPYAPPPGPWYQAAPPAYTPSPTGYYGWVPPTHIFPDQPPANSVFMTDMPPPYPGINTGYSGYATAPPQGASAPPPPGKSEEAAQSAYYDPNKPQCAYVPPPAYYEPPPSYQQNGYGKKNQ